MKTEFGVWHVRISRHADRPRAFREHAQVGLSHLKTRPLLATVVHAPDMAALSALSWITIQEIS